jgi:hypothetical protein
MKRNPKGQSPNTHRKYDVINTETIAAERAKSGNRYLIKKSFAACGYTYEAYMLLAH